MFFFTLHENIFTEITLSLIFITLWQSWQKIEHVSSWRDDSSLVARKKKRSLKIHPSEQGIFFFLENTEDRPWSSDLTQK
jgi:hypothetical protein